MKYLYLIIASAFAVAFTSCKEADAEADASFAKSTFEALARGDSSAADNIDWETLNSLGTPVGSTYSAMQKEEDKAAFRKNFIAQFSSSFRDSGGKLEDFTNWRVTTHDDTHTEVSADGPNGTMVITVSERNDVERVSVLELAQ
ncbi:hypothetical protein [Luteolibacter sp. AS25]|uniref:hypothetical protein n=1 Tax=Luteolibacter sp. AS25 TaxID=3135776 RepID=UPI00398A7DF1